MGSGRALRKEERAGVGRAGGRSELRGVWGGKMAEPLQHHSVEGVAGGHAVESGVSGGAQGRVLALIGFLLTVSEFP